MNSYGAGSLLDFNINKTAIEQRSKNYYRDHEPKRRGREDGRPFRSIWPDIFPEMERGSF